MEFDLKEIIRKKYSGNQKNIGISNSISPFSNIDWRTSLVVK